MPFSFAYPVTDLDRLDINYISSGGAQTPTSGWGHSVEAYKARFATVVQDAKRIHARGGVQVIKISDLWGADATQPSSFPYPGDNGDWSSYDRFIQQLISDVKSSGVAINERTQLEPYNEPDLPNLFWRRGQEQYLQMWLRGTRALRAAFPKGSRTFLPIVGPSAAMLPGSSNMWWKNFLSTLRDNRDTEPDIWNFHLEGGDSNDPVPATKLFKQAFAEYGLTGGIGFTNNEYGSREQQRPGFGAWHAARYEKVKYHGLRGNWAGGALLRDNLADLLLKDAGGKYHTTGEFQEWATYAGLSGSPCNTTEGSSIDTYGIATPANKTASALVGNQGFTGTANVVFGSVSSLGSNINMVKAVVYRIPYDDGREVTGLTLVSTTTIHVSQDQVTVPFHQTNADDAYLVTILAA